MGRIARFGLAVALLAPPHLVSMVRAGTLTATPSDDTFINSAAANNNNGGNGSIFTGTNGQLGLMRGLLRFALPENIAGRATVTRALMGLTTQQLPNLSAPVAANMYLYRITQPWIEGTGVATGGGVIGVACTAGATWNKPNCATAVNWTTPGGSVAAASGSFFSPHSSETNVSADSNGGANTGMVADAQGWLDTPTGNYGWLLFSSTEGAASSLPQRFHATESGTALPSLQITFSCKPGFADTGTTCTACTAGAQSSCAVSAGNSCVDPGAPSSYACSCTNPLYRVSVDGLGNPVGLRGTSLTNGAIGPNATRTGMQVESYVQSLVP